MSTKVTLAAIAKRLDKIEANQTAQPAAPTVVVVTTTTAEQAPVCPKPEPLEWHSVTERLPSIPESIAPYKTAALVVCKNLNGSMSVGSFFNSRFKRRFNTVTNGYQSPVMWWAYQNPSAARAAGCR